MLIRPVHRGPTLNNILPRLNSVKYMSIIDTSLGCDNLKLDEKSLYLTTFACSFGQYHYKQLPFRAAPVGNMFQHKIDKIFTDVPNVFGIVNDILVIGYEKNEADHDAVVHKVLWRCKEVKLKLNTKKKYHFRCTSIPSFGEVISRRGVQPDPQEIKALTDMPAPNNKKELQAFLGIINYFGKFSLGTADVCDPLHKLTSSKVIWTWNASYQSLFNKAKLLIKSDMCMKFYNDTKLLHLDASGEGLGAALLQTQEGTTWQKDMVPDNTILHPIAFASKSLTGAEHRYSNIEREALCMGLKSFITILSPGKTM